MVFTILCNVALCISEAANPSKFESHVRFLVRSSPMGSVFVEFFDDRGLTTKFEYVKYPDVDELVSEDVDTIATTITTTATPMPANIQPATTILICGDPENPEKPTSEKYITEAKDKTCTCHACYPRGVFMFVLKFCYRR